MRSELKWVRFILAVLVLAANSPRATAQQTAEEWRTVEDRWYILELAGAKAGWSSTIVETDGKQFRTVSETNVKISRGEIPIEISMATSFVETAEGKPVSTKLKQKTSLQAVDTEWRFLDDHVEMVTRQGGRETKSQLPKPEGEWLPPHAADQYARTQHKSGVEKFSYRTIDPENGLKPITVTSKRVRTETVDVNGKPTEVTVWSSLTDIMPIEAIERVDGDGTLVSTESMLPGIGKMMTRLATKAEAKVESDGPAPELLVQTFITPDKPIKDSSNAIRATLRLKVKQGKMPAIPAAGAQRVEMSDDGQSAVLNIDINDNLPAAETDLSNTEFTSASAMVDINDDLIKKLSNRGLEGMQEQENSGAGDLMKQAEALRKFVHRHISKKGMQTAFASASETAKTRTEDCSEHGVLLCALLRAAGIPARVASGLVYANSFEGHEGIFGWHMWTQALIDGKWVDFDATLPRRYNAAHVLTGTSSLSDGLGSSDLASLIQLIGNLDIEVVQVEYAAKEK